MISNVEQFVTERYLAAVNAMQDREEGQGLVEYALIIALVAVFLTASLVALRTGIIGTFTSVTASL